MATESFIPAKAKLRVLQKAYPQEDTYKLALYSSNPGSANYTSRGEVSGKGYSPGGINLTGYSCDMSGNTAYVNFSSPQWPNSTITASFGLIYNASDSNSTVSILEFEETISKNGLFIVEFPANGPAAIISL